MAQFWHRPGFRRWLALVALLLGLLLAWRSARHRTQTVQVSWLLTHVEVDAAPGVTLDRSRLVRLTWRVPEAPGSHQFIQEQRIDFAAGAAPEATHEFELLLPPEVAEVDVACRFALTPDALPIRTHGRATVDRSRTGVIVVDVGSCGVRER